MADPTLKDVLDAISKLDARVGRVEAKVDKVDAKVEAHRAETAKGFADLDAELSRHADRTHRDLEKRVERLEKQARPVARPARRPRAR